MAIRTRSKRRAGTRTSTSRRRKAGDSNRGLTYWRQGRTKYREDRNRPSEAGNGADDDAIEDVDGYVGRSGPCECAVRAGAAEWGRGARRTRTRRRTDGRKDPHAEAQSL